MADTTTPTADDCAKLLQDMLDELIKIRKALVGGD